jgi:S1-C subfamily serine protease
VRAAVDSVLPAVVHISNEQIRPGQATPIQVAGGSGVIYDHRGLILTSGHVVWDAYRLRVTLGDSRTVTARLLGQDPQTDVAVLQIDLPDLPVARLGDSRALKVGDYVVAVGYALDIPGTPTVTGGLVGALERTIQAPGLAENAAGPYLFDLIQTDAAINPGNSGGPLVNLRGEVVGLNTLTLGDPYGEWTHGLGFANPMHIVKPIADEIVATGRVAHAWLGIGYSTVPAPSGATIEPGVPVGQGALVIAVTPASPAATAGLRVQDVIVEVDGVAIKTQNELTQLLQRRHPGDQLSLTILRGPNRLTLTATLGTQPTR